MSVESVDDLYALPLAEFTAARNALAKSSGDKSIARLKKPSAAAWALNQAARSNKGDVARYLHAAAAVREGASRDEIDDMRAAEGDVRRAALRALGGRGDAQLSAVNSLLAAAAADSEVGEVLRAGRLVGDEEADATALMFAAPAAKSARRPAAKAAESAKSAKSAAKKDEVKEARERRAREEERRKAEERKAALKEAQAEADRLEREAAEAEDKAARLRERADRAKAKLEALRA